MVIAILTMRRWTRERKLAPEQYLTPLVDNIMSPLSEDEKKHVSFLIFNVDKDPDQHKEVQELKKKYSDRIEVMVKPHHDSKPLLAPGSDGRITVSYCYS
jgi:lipopolysaccharide biosynthesis glycosyltransferase